MNAWRRTPLFGRSPNSGQRGEAALWRVLAAGGNARVRRPYGDISPTSQKRTESNMTGTPRRAPHEEPRSARLFVGARRGFQFLREPRNAGETLRMGDSASRVMRLAMLVAHTFSPSSSIAFRQKMRSFWSSVIGSLSTSSISRFGVLQGRSLPKRM